MNRVGSFSLLDEIVNETIDDIKGSFEKLTSLPSSSSSSSSSSHLPQQISIVYQYASEQVTSELTIQPFTPMMVKDINLTRIISLIHINLLDNHQDVNSFLVKLSDELNSARRVFFTSKDGLDIDGDNWVYPSLLQFIMGHFYNYVTPFSYGKSVKKIQNPLVSCKLFVFEYFISLFTQFTRFLKEAKKYQRIKNYKETMECFREALEIIDYMISYALSIEKGDEENTNINRFLYVQSPNAMSSSSSLKSSSNTPPIPTRHFLTSNMVRQDMSVVIDYFGGRHALPMLNHLTKAQRCGALYDYKCLKLGGLDDGDHLVMLHHVKTHTEFTYDDHYVELFELSKTVQSHYEDAWKLLLMSHTTPNTYPIKTRLYYFVLFMKHYWLCRHHFTIMIYDYYLYDQTGEDLKHAKSILTRALLLIHIHNDFLKYNLFDRPVVGSQSMISDIISTSILKPYERMIHSITQLHDAFANIVNDVHMSSPMNVTDLKSYNKIDFPSKESNLGVKLEKLFHSKLNGVNLHHVDSKLQSFKESYFNQTTSHSSDNDDDEENENDNDGIYTDAAAFTLSDGEKRSILSERHRWITCLLNRMITDSGIIVINEEDTQKIILELDMINGILTTNNSSL